MQRVTTAALTVLMAFSLMLSLSSTASANALTGGGYSSSYSGESVFTNQPAGGSGQFSAIFFNDGTQTWASGVVGLLVCAADKTTCNVASPNAAYASGWFSATVYATVSATVPPGSNGFFVYNFVVPAGTAAGTVATFPWWHDRWHGSLADLGGSARRWPAAVHRDRCSRRRDRYVVRRRWLRRGDQQRSVRRNSDELTDPAVQRRRERRWRERVGCDHGLRTGGIDQVLGYQADDPR